MIVHLSHLRYLTSQTPSEHKRQKANKKELSRRLLLLVLTKIRSELLLCIVACPVAEYSTATTQEKVVVHLPMIIYQLLTFTSNKEEKERERH